MSHTGTGGIRVAIAEDQQLIKKMLALVIHAQPDMAMIGEARDGNEAISLCQERRPDVILMDISMPVMDRISATREIHNLLPDTRVLILTAYDDDSHVFQGIKAGARGYLRKDCTPEDLTSAIRTVYAEDTITSPSIADKMLESFQHNSIHTSGQSLSLTKREIEIVTALAQGKSNKQIAEALYISERTVRNHTSNIYRKLQISDRTQAALYAVRQGLVNLGD